MPDFSSCLKGYTRDLDKAVPPEQTVASIRSVLQQTGHDILQETKRVDTGRLGIPVYMSICGPQARQIMPTRKQMGKGASPAQAEASALMELIERYSLFAFLQAEGGSPGMTWTQAQTTAKNTILPVREILHSVHEERPEAEAVKILDLVRWTFCPGTELRSGREVLLPLDWFRTINEFNGSSAGNVAVESVLQGLCELVERHVSAAIDRNHPELPSIDPGSLNGRVLEELHTAFSTHGIRIWLKDFSLDSGVPTVGALAYDPATFPESSEIVFTAGTATSPEKAAIRALTEVAQLAGDFETGSCYEPSGLSKFTSLEDCQWLMRGPSVPLSSLPDISHQDMGVELSRLGNLLSKQGYSAYTVNTTRPELDIPTHYNVVPGFDFRERSTNPSLGLFVGRILVENSPEHDVVSGLHVLESIYPGAHFLPFFQGLFALRRERYDEAVQAFTCAEPVQPTAQDQGFAAFYRAYSLSIQDAWEEAEQDLNRAIQLAPDVHAFFNLRGVGFFKSGRYEQAIQDFQAALRLDPGSAMDLANLGVCFKRLGQVDQAVHYLQAATELAPDLEGPRAELDELMTRS